MKDKSKPPKKILSDQLGCFPQQVDAMRENAKQHHLPVEFVPDKTSLEPNGEVNFYHAKFENSHDRDKYAAFCGKYDRSGYGGGATLTPEHLADAERLIKIKYGVPKRAGRGHE